MESYYLLGLTLLCMALYYRPVSADCGTLKGTLIKGCVNVFVLANADAKNGTTCMTDKLKEKDCSGYSVFKTCLTEDGRTGDCVSKTTQELSDSGMKCTFKEIQDTCGASFLSCSLFTLVIAVILAMFN